MESAEIRTGIENFDEAMGGVKPGEVCVIGGHPSMGKTSLALQIIINNQSNVFYISAGENKQTLINRLISICSSVDLKGNSIESLKRKNLLGGIQYQSFLAAIDNFNENSSIEIKEVNGFVIEHYLNSARDWIKDKGDEKSKFIVIDHVQALSCERRETRREELEDIMIEIKMFALNHRVPVFVTSQLSRFQEGRSVRPPKLTDLKGSSAIEELADKIIFPFRMDYYDPLIKPGIMELILAKNKSGPSEINVEAIFRKETGEVIEYKKLVLDDDFIPDNKIIISRTIFKQMEALKDEMKSCKLTDEESLDIARKYDKLRIQLLNVGSKDGSRKPKDCIE